MPKPPTAQIAAASTTGTLEEVIAPAPKTPARTITSPALAIERRDHCVALWACNQEPAVQLTEAGVSVKPTRISDCPRIAFSTRGRKASAPKNDRFTKP